MDLSYVGRNQSETRRLAELVGKLSQADLDRSLGEGWTVNAALAHLAFWDRYAVALLEGWGTGGFQPVAASADHINTASLNGWLALPAEYVLREVVAAAEAADHAATSVAPDLAEDIADGGRSRILDRTGHRSQHIAQIQAALNT